MALGVWHTRRPVNAPGVYGLGPLYRAALRRPYVVLVLAGLLAGLLALQARGLAFAPRIDLLSPRDALFLAEQERLAVFGPDFRVVVALMKPAEEGGVLNRFSLEGLAALHAELEALPHVSRVASLVNSPALVGSPGIPAGAPIWAGSSDEAVGILSQRLDGSLLQKRIFLSHRRALTPLYVELDPHAAEPDAVRDILRLAAAVERRHPRAGHVLAVGPAVVETSLAQEVLDDLQRLVPFSVALMALGLLVAFRSLAFFLVTIVHSLLLVLFVLGGMAACGVSVNLVNVLAPVLIVPLGVAPLLHLLVRLKSGVDGVPGPGRRASTIGRALARLEGALLGTTGTTAVGFLGFLFTPVPAIRQFGLILSAGAIVSLILTLTVDCALLALTWRQGASRKTVAARRATWIERWLLAMTRTRAMLRLRAGRALAVSLVLAAGGLVALWHLRIDDTWLQNFDPDSTVATHARLFESELLGTNLLSIRLEADPAVAGAGPRLLDLLNELPLVSFGVPGVRGVVSVMTLVRSMDPQQGTVLDPWPTPSRERLAQACEEWKRRGLPLPRIDMLADPELSRFQVLIFVANDHLWELRRTLAGFESILEHRAKPGVVFQLGGNLAANIRMVRQSVVSQGYSVLAMLLVMGSLALIYTRSLRSAAMIIAPQALAILTTYLVIAGLEVPYGVAVSMFPTLMIGMADDFAIHGHAALARTRSASRRRLARELGVVIKGILLNSALWAAGFAVLTSSHQPPTRYLGLLCSTVVVLAAALTLLLLPAAILLTRGSSAAARTDQSHVPSRGDVSG